MKHVEGIAVLAEKSQPSGRHHPLHRERGGGGGREHSVEQRGGEGGGDGLPDHLNRHDAFAEITHDGRERDERQHRAGGDERHAAPKPRPASLVANQNRQRRAGRQRVPSGDREGVGGVRGQSGEVERKPHERRRREDHRAGGEEAATGDREHEQGPQQVELLFDGERPEVAQALRTHAERTHPVRRVGPVPPLIPERVGAPRLEMPRMGHDDECHREKRIVQREYPERAPNVEGPEIALRAHCVEQDSRNQVSGEDEKKLDSGPAGLADRAHQLWHQKGAGALDLGQGVEQDDENRHASHAVDRRNVAGAVASNRPLSPRPRRWPVRRHGPVAPSRSSSMRLASMVNLAAQLSISNAPYPPSTGNDPLTPPRMPSLPASDIVRRTK